MGAFAAGNVAAGDHAVRVPDHLRIGARAGRQRLEHATVGELGGTQDLSRRVHRGGRHAVRLQQRLRVLLGELACPRGDVLVDLFGRLDARFHGREPFGPRGRAHRRDHAPPLMVFHRRDAHLTVAAR